MADLYEFHEIANVWPLMEGDDYAALVADVAANGLIQPVWLYEGKLLDGRNRYRACVDADVELRAETYTGDDPIGFAVSLNDKRRHLSKSQRGMVGANIEEYQQGRPNKDANLHVKRQDAAELLDVSPRTIATAKQVKSHGDEELIKEVESGKKTVNRAAQEIKHKVQREEKAQQVKKASGSAIISKDDCIKWLQKQEPCDLLLTDPPYSTDVDDIEVFANEWLPIALAKVKPTGRAYVCVGAYPEELLAYLDCPTGDMLLRQVLVWTYRNTLGPSPKIDYKLNWQAILYYVGPDAPPLDCPVMTEQFSVQDINAPDGRLGDRYHAWQKPEELARRFVSHSTKPGQTVLDPFAGTGTFLIAAKELGCDASGCDASDDMIETAQGRGVSVA